MTIFAQSLTSDLNPAPHVPNPSTLNPNPQTMTERGHLLLSFNVESVSRGVFFKHHHSRNFVRLSGHGDVGGIAIGHYLWPDETGRAAETVDDR